MGVSNYLYPGSIKEHFKVLSSHLAMSIKERKRSIATGRGDRGYTYVYSGDKLSKDDLRLEVAGTIDELSSFLGMAKSLVEDKSGKDILEKIQNDLFVVGSQISGLGYKKKKKIISSRHIKYLEDEIEKLEGRYVFKDFVLPGESLASSTLHIARSVARRLERRMVTLINKEKLKSQDALVYLNRLSDLLFLLACQYSS